LRYLIEHETALAFATPVREHHFELRLAPRDTELVRVARCQVRVTPEVELREHVDSFGNRVQRGSLMAPHDGIALRLEAEVQTLLENPFAWSPLEPAEERAWLERRLREEPPLHDYLLHRSAAVPEAAVLEDLDAPTFDPARGVLRNLQETVAWVRESFAYEPGVTDVHAPLAHFIECRAGVCQDFAHLVLALVRSWGVPARYVAGYVDPGSDRQGPESTHAWAEVLIPGAGWLGFDATHDLVVNDLYVPVAVGRDSRDAAPIRGTFKGDAQEESPHVQLRVVRQAQAQAQTQ
jgi:transglutaminase-like putative cysteine protease